MDKKYSVATMINPATKHVEYLPLDEVKMSLEENETFTLRWFYNRIVELNEKVEALETKLKDLEESKLKDMQDKQANINDLVLKSIALANEKISVVETDVDLLKNLK